jgi:hypothetical protein
MGLLTARDLRSCCPRMIRMAVSQGRSMLANVEDVLSSVIFVMMVSASGETIDNRSRLARSMVYAER